ncbi:MAG TPA: hypothetical protein VIT65_26290 [Microlunatus sp.]
MPRTAVPRVTERYDSGREREVAYLLGEEVVAVRQLSEDGQLELHSTRRAGVRHGPECSWDDTGRLRSLIPYVDGLEHGRAFQWGASGAEIGDYVMDHGTGVDLWRAERPDGSVYLVEARYMVSGERHGFEWVVAEDQEALVREGRFAAGVEHGIFREWDDSALNPSFPIFYLLGRAVGRDEYGRARRIDPGLPDYRAADDRPERAWPVSVGAQLRPRRAS